MVMEKNIIRIIFTKGKDILISFSQTDQGEKAHKLPISEIKEGPHHGSSDITYKGKLQPTSCSQSQQLT